MGLFLLFKSAERLGDGIPDRRTLHRGHRRVGAVDEDFGRRIIRGEWHLDVSRPGKDYQAYPLSFQSTHERQGKLPRPVYPAGFNIFSPHAIGNIQGNKYIGTFLRDFCRARTSLRIGPGQHHKRVGHHGKREFNSVLGIGEMGSHALQEGALSHAALASQPLFSPVVENRDQNRNGDQCPEALTIFPLKLQVF